jgi:hypothetical protein
MAAARSRAPLIEVYMLKLRGVALALSFTFALAAPPSLLANGLGVGGVHASRSKRAKHSGHPSSKTSGSSKGGMTTTNPYVKGNTKGSRVADLTGRRKPKDGKRSNARNNLSETRDHTKTKRNS